MFQLLFLLKKNCIYKIYFTYSFEFLYFFQHSLLGCSQYCGLKVLFTNLIRKLKNNDIFEGSDSQGILILFCLGYQYFRDSKYKTVLCIVTALKQAEYKNCALIAHPFIFAYGMYYMNTTDKETITSNFLISH